MKKASRKVASIGSRILFYSSLLMLLLTVNELLDIYELRMKEDIHDLLSTLFMIGAVMYLLPLLERYENKLK